MKLFLHLKLKTPPPDIQIIQYLFRFVLTVVSNQWVDHTPQWCTHSYRRELQWGGGVTLEQCKQLCPSCAAIEYWSGNTKVCFECLDHTKRESFTNINDGAYPPHVYIRQWTSSSFVTGFLLTCVHISIIEIKQYFGTQWSKLRSG